MPNAVIPKNKTNKKPKKLSFSRFSRVQKFVLAIFVVGFGAIGAYLIIASHAETLVSNGSMFMWAADAKVDINSDTFGTVTANSNGGNITTLKKTGEWYGLPNGTWSSDGTGVMYFENTWENNVQFYTLYKSNPDGSQKQALFKSQVTDPAGFVPESSTLSVSPDGQWVAYTQAARPYSPPGKPNTNYFALYVARTNGQEKRLVFGSNSPNSTEYNGVLNTNRPSWSADGTTLLFTTDRHSDYIDKFGNADYSFAMYNIQTQKTTEVMKQKYSDSQYSYEGNQMPVWYSKDTILYVRNYYCETAAYSGQYCTSLKLVNIDGTNKRVLVEYPQINKDMNGNTLPYPVSQSINSLSISPDRTKIAYTVSDSAHPATSYPGIAMVTRLYMMNIDGTNPGLFTPLKDLQIRNFSWQPVKTTVAQYGKVQGSLVIGTGVGVKGGPFPTGTGSVTVDISTTKDNPFSLGVTAGKHTITAPDKITYNGTTWVRSGYTLCYNVTTCHTGKVTNEVVANLDVPANGYADIQWHYEQGTTKPIEVHMATLKGQRVIGSGKSTTNFPSGTGSTTIDNQTVLTTNPFSQQVTALVQEGPEGGAPPAPVRHTVTSAQTIVYNGKTYDLDGYTLCSNTTSCHDGTPIPVSTATVEVPNNGYADISWHYKQRAEEPKPVTDPNANFTMAFGVGGYSDAGYKKTTTVLGPNTRYINYDWKTASPITGVQPDWFYTAWTGTFVAPGTGTYTFYSEQDDGFLLNLNYSKTNTIDKWYSPGPTGQGTADLKAGQKVVLWAYMYDFTGNAKAKLYWSGPGISGKQLFPDLVNKFGPQK